ncbi:MAG TPA: dienelactone hydrolase family protein [Noviherbaspirillum sp.]|nr:dienelactone hydrolase family protein [Noviherbaspirillum sp.]
MRIEQVTIDAGSVALDGVLWLPEGCLGVVLFASSNGGIRVRPPNDYVASVLRGARLATLWMDLLTAQERSLRDTAADTGALASRMEAACNWLRRHDAAGEMPIGLFGAGQGAAAALQLAAAPGQRIAAIVARSGRPDLAEQGALARISAPTLLIVGGLDDGVVALNRAAYAALRCRKRFEIVPGATHAFDEPGSLEVVARLARSWFLRYASTAERY